MTAGAEGHANGRGASIASFRYAGESVVRLDLTRKVQGMRSLDLALGWHPRHLRFLPGAAGRAPGPSGPDPLQSQLGRDEPARRALLFGVVDVLELGVVSALECSGHSGQVSSQPVYPSMPGRVTTLATSSGGSHLGTARNTTAKRTLRESHRHPGSIRAVLEDDRQAIHAERETLRVPLDRPSIGTYDELE